MSDSESASADLTTDLVFDSLESMMAARRRLDTADIPTRIENIKTPRGKGFRLDPIFERQLPDAVARLNNPDHVIAHPISDEERIEARTIIAKEQQGNVLRIAWQLSQFVTGGLILAALLVWLIKTFSP